MTVELERYLDQQLRSVNGAVREYKSNLHTPELLTEVHQTIWQVRGGLIDENYEVGPCPYTKEELSDLEKQGRRLGYLPVELATQESRHLFRKIFQDQDPALTKHNSVTNDENPSGWFDYEIGVSAPYLNTTEQQLREILAAQGRKLLSLNQYLVASHDSYLLAGRYLDKDTWVRLGSRWRGRLVRAQFGPYGFLEVHRHIGPSYHTRILGGRSSGVKKLKILIL